MLAGTGRARAPSHRPGRRAADRGPRPLVALDWWSGNRSVLVDHDLSGLLVGLTLTTRAEDVYRALLESTAFGARVIVETFAASGVPVTEFIGTVGCRRTGLLMQIYADVLDMPLSVVRLEAGPGPRLRPARGGRCRRLRPTCRPQPRRSANRQQAAFTPDRRERRGLRPVVRGLPRAARPLGPGCQRCHAHPQVDPSGGPRMTGTTPISDAVRGTVDAAARARWPTCTPSWSATAWSSWTAGNVSAGVPG